MFTVALIGPDGAGKTSACRGLAEMLPLPVKYVYMGVSSDSSNYQLPTTRLVHRLKRACGAPPDAAGPRDHREVTRKSGNGPSGWLRGGRSYLRLVNRMAEEWYRQLLAWYFRCRGNLVLFDRHFFCDYFTYDVQTDGAPVPLARRIHGAMLKRVFPRPDLVIYLDAPGEVLFARKGEGTPALLERRRQDYLSLRGHVPEFMVVDASQPECEVIQEVYERVMQFHASRTTKPVEPAGNANRTCADRAGH